MLSHLFEGKPFYVLTFCLSILLKSILSLFSQLFAIVRYMHGPFGIFLCQMEYLAKNIVTLKFICFISFTSTIRCIFIVYSKNPTAVQDRFWWIILEVWALSKFFNLRAKKNKLLFTFFSQFKRNELKPSL